MVAKNTWAYSQGVRYQDLISIGWDPCKESICSATFGMEECEAQPNPGTADSQGDEGNMISDPRDDLRSAIVFGGRIQTMLALAFAACT